MIDYRKVLIAYIDHVGHCEGTDFLPATLDDLTTEENIALHEAAAETANDAHAGALIGHAGHLRVNR